MLKNNRGANKRENWQDLLNAPGAEMVAGVLLVDHKEAGRLKEGVFYVTHPENMPDATDEDKAKAAPPEQQGTQFMTNTVDPTLPPEQTPEDKAKAAKSKDVEPDPHPDPSAHPPEDAPEHSGRRSKTT
jgi:hypothetical protein